MTKRHAELLERETKKAADLDGRLGGESETRSTGVERCLRRVLLVVHFACGRVHCVPGTLHFRRTCFPCRPSATTPQTKILFLSPNIHSMPKNAGEHWNYIGNFTVCRCRLPCHHTWLPTCHVTRETETLSNSVCGTRNAMPTNPLQCSFTMIPLRIFTVFGGLRRIFFADMFLCSQPHSDLFLLIVTHDH